MEGAEAALTAERRFLRLPIKVLGQLPQETETSGDAAGTGKDVNPMLTCDGSCFALGWWLIFPVAMIIMCALCFSMMRRRMTPGCSCWSACSGSAKETPEKPSALNEIPKNEPV